MSGHELPPEVHVVIPARNEEVLLGQCLESVSAAVDHAGAGARVTVVLDRCTDRTESVAAAYAVDLVRSDVGSVGGARSAGVGRVRDLSNTTPPAQVWVAMTDADSRVPLDWLASHVEQALAGVELLVGGVRPDPADVGDRVWREWAVRDREQLNIHGANLGFTLDLHARAGGFPAVAEHEDVGFVRSALALGCRWTTDVPPVVTSARTLGRTPGGFAGYLRTLHAEVADS
jgi:glycosyltransferase involved in cell wall biosynthesis